MGVLRIFVALLRGLLTSRSALMAENLALRQQLNVMKRSVNPYVERLIGSIRRECLDQ